MTIPYCVQIGDPVSDREAVIIEEIICSTFVEIHQIYNNWNPDSEISKLNQSPAHSPLLLSNELALFLKQVDTLVTFTEGRFDPTVGPLSHLWKKSLQEERLPPDQELAKCQAAVGWNKVHCEQGYFWKEEPMTALDLGGIAKGYGVDLLVQKLGGAGFKNIYVEWGGEISTRGLHPENRTWKIGIEGLSTIDLTNSAIATSGSYVQNWTINSINYTHIIDPHTRLPLNNAPISSASVIASTCLEADALATSLMLFPSKEEAEEWAKEHNLKVFIW